MDALTQDYLVPSNRFQGSVLVTGAGGCIGAWVLAILSRSGVPVVATDLTDARARPALLMGDAAAQALTWEICDITDAARIRALAEQHQAQAIIHLAGLQVPFCMANPGLGARVNVEGTINVLQTARELGLKRTVFASSSATHGMPPGGPYRETLYWAYKLANEHTAYVYWADWQVPSVGIRPNVVYGLARDQGVSSKNTIAIQAVARGEAFEMPFTGPYSWLYAGEAAAAFIAAVSQDQTGAHVFDLNGRCETLEAGLGVLNEIAPGAQIRCTGTPFPFPVDLDDGPLQAHVGGYPTISVAEGVTATYRAMAALHAEGRLPALPG